MAKENKGNSAPKRAETKASKSIKDTKVAKVVEAKRVEVKKDTKVTIAVKKVTFAQFLAKNKELLLNLLWVFIAIVGLFLVDLFVQYINNDYSAAVVNNKRISMKSLRDRLVERSGELMVSDMIREEIIWQSAKDADVEVTEEEINAEYDRIVKLYGGEESFRTALTTNGYTKESYLASLEIQLVAQKTIVKDPSEKELQTFFDESKEIYFASQETFETDKANVKRVYVQTQFESEFPTWFQKKLDDSDIKNNLEEEPEYGFFMATRNIFENIYNRITDKKDSK